MKEWEKKIVAAPTYDDDASFDAVSSEEAQKKAQENGWATVFPKATELQLDIDSAAAYATYKKNRALLEKYWGIVDEKETPSKSGGAWRKHVTITLGKQLSPPERIALQAVLGSDLKRELYSLCRMRAGDPQPTLFFEKE